MSALAFAVTPQAPASTTPTDAGAHPAVQLAKDLLCYDARTYELLPVGASYLPRLLGSAPAPVLPFPMLA